MTKKLNIEIDLGCDMCLRKLQQIQIYLDDKRTTRIFMSLSKDPDYEHQYHIEECECR